MDPKPLRTADVARLVGRSASSLRQLERLGVIPIAARDRANQRRFSQRDVAIITEALLTPARSK
jgi:DNA-binding transcriptional MerR regulator